MQDWLQSLDSKLQKYAQADLRLPFPLYGVGGSSVPSELTKGRSVETFTDEGIFKIKEEVAAEEEAVKSEAQDGDGSNGAPAFKQPLSRSASYETAKLQASFVESCKKLISDSLDLEKSGLGQTRIAKLHRSVAALASRIVNSTYFNIFFAVVILTNSVYLGAQVELTANSGTMFVHPVWFAIHLAYVGLFSVEILLRVVAVGPVSYLFGSGWAWHWLDTVAVSWPSFSWSSYHGQALVAWS